jgi:6-phosphogluconolactonase
VFSNYAIGCYTDRPGGKKPGKGISLISLDEERGVLSEQGIYEKVKNPSYLWFDKSSGLMLAATENGQNEGSITSFTLKGKTLQENSVIDGPGKSNCHVNAFPAGNLAFAASYGEGHSKIYKLIGNELTETLLDYAYKGQGPNTKRQEHSHAHQAVLAPHKAFLYVVDLGCDAIWIHDIAHIESEPVKISTPPGLGPRHMVFHGNKAYVLCELIPTLLVFDYDSATGKLSLIQEIATVEDPETSPSQPAAIKVHPSGKTLVVSNRFADSVTLFSLSASGKVERTAIFDSRGKICRDLEFSPSGEWLLMAHQDSSSIELCRFDGKTGLFFR